MLMTMTPVQNEIFLLIHYILNSDYYRENHSKPGLKEIFKSAIRQFPENNSENKKTWKNVDLYLKNHRISERAAKIIDNHDGEGDLWRLLHYEHIIPVSSTINALLNLGKNPSREAVRDVLFKSEVIILSKEESNILDGNVYNMYPLEKSMVNGKGMRSSGSKEERLNSLDIKIDKRYSENRL